MRVVFADTVHPILWEQLEQAGFRCIRCWDMPLDDVFKELEQAEGLVIRSRFTVNASLLDKSKNLKFIARSGAGMENIDLETAHAHGVQCFNAPEGNRNAVAEHALAMLLALFNKIVKADGEVRSGTWDREGNRGIELAGKTVGIIGYGNTGSAFADKLSGMDCRVPAYDKYKNGFSSGHVSECKLEDIQATADIISFHVPYNRETHHYLDASFIEKCHKNCYIINTSRGQVVDTKALLTGLENGKVAGACLDVLEAEGPSFEKMDAALMKDFKKLTRQKNTVLSPHVAGWTHESYQKLSQVLADKILRHFKASPS